MQRFVSRAIQAFACLALLTTLNIAVQAADVNGTWTWTTPGRNGGQDRKSVLKLKTEGDKLTGTINGRQEDIKISDGKVTGDEVTFKVSRAGQNGNSFTQKYTGKVSGDSIKGKVTFERNGQEQSRDWEAKREKDEKK
ncbi:MAG TPA: hypothetical protein VI282_07785 [Verrucomicrobiae bacterium]